MMYIVSRKWYHGSLPRKYTSPFWTKLPYDCSRVQSMNAKTPRSTGTWYHRLSRSEGTGPIRPADRSSRSLRENDWQNAHKACDKASDRRRKV